MHTIVNLMQKSGAERHGARFSRKQKATQAPKQLHAGPLEE